jgi:hypothetical protein
MDIFKPTHTELRLFLKKYLKLEMEDVVDVTVLRLEPITESWMSSMFMDGKITPRSAWNIEVACRDGMRGARRYEDLISTVKKYISLFGEEPHLIKLSRVFIV